ncbi:FAD-linked oxidase [Sporanaerobium hydrogeniformans]|uniref:FAD-linked oxidase n=2 Tax=Sporanaerobium hydrogeniformans TaxID=3072179 RepID=A0AC61DAS0_9FIRM|nr:FAD-linked oxidase [Sporanaerobium hydrogeniformans]
MKLTLDKEGLSGKVITRENPYYETARTMWNRAIQSYPLAIVYCNNEEDVKNSILWARKHQVPIRIRSGGHHYEGYSTGNDVLVIDVSKMQGILLDESAKKITIEGGVRNRELYEFLGARGYPFPGGGCPTVGVVGFALGGGWSYSGRMYGLACDCIVEARLINYEGKLIIANEKENRELLWALKGSGGGQFGVITSMTFALSPQKQEATLIRIEYSHVTRLDQIKMFQLWQNQIESMCHEANFKLSFYHSKTKGLGMLLIGICYDNTEKAHKIIEPFIKLGYKLQVLVQSMSVLEVNRWIQDAHPDFEHYKSSGRFVKEKFNSKQIQNLLECIEELAEGAVYTALSCYGMGGEMLKPKKEEVAFSYRDSRYILGFQTVWEDNSYSIANQFWFKERFKRIEQQTCGSFVNFPASEIQNYQKAYWAEAYLKLSQLKNKYDPDGVFDFEQTL